MNKIIKYFVIRYIILIFLLLNIYLSLKQIVLFYSTGFVNYQYQINSIVFILVALFCFFMLIDLKNYQFNGEVGKQ